MLPLVKGQTQIRQQLVKLVKQHYIIMEQLLWPKELEHIREHIYIVIYFTQVGHHSFYKEKMTLLLFFYFFICFLYS
jgi:methyl coenzyme M reductase subunit C